MLAAPGVTLGRGNALAPWSQGPVAMPGWLERTCSATTALDTTTAEPCLWAGQQDLHCAGQELAAVLFLA